VTVASGILGYQADVAGFQGTGVLDYTYAVSPAAVEAGKELAPTAIGTLSVYTGKEHPETGNKIEGWKWDKRVWADDATESWDTYVPGNWDASTSGILTAYFQSGIGSGQDLELLDICYIPSSGIRENIYGTWMPEINHGYYYNYSEQGYLHSDDSEVIYPSYSGLLTGVSSTFNTVDLLSYHKASIPITAESYYWNEDDGEYEVDVAWRKRPFFTGTTDSEGNENSTYSVLSDVTYWDNIDPTEKEFVVLYSGVTVAGVPTVAFNQQCVSAVGSADAGGVSFSGLEIIGTSTGAEGQEFHLGYSPIDSTMPITVLSFATIPSGTISAGTLALGTGGYGMNGGGLLPSGIIEGGYLATDVYEWLPRDDGTTFSGYNVNVDYDLGLLHFSSDSSLASIPPAGHYIGVSYYKTVRVEYEPDQGNESILGVEANLNPIYRRSGRGFVYLSNAIDDPASITLRADLPVISTNVFGPLDIGNNYAPVIATVLDSRGNPLEDQSVTIYITSEPSIGSFGSLGTSTDTVTDEDGEATVYYNPPRTISDIGEEVEAANHLVDNSPSYSGVTQATTLVVEDLLVDGEIEDIFLFQNYVDDPIMGLLDTTLDHGNLDAQLDAYYLSYLQEHQIYGPTGLLNLTTLNYYLSGSTWEASHRFLKGLLAPTIFQSDTGAGRRVLTAIPDSEALDPHTFQSNAWAPMQPIDIVQSGTAYRLVYDTSTYSIPVPSGSLTVGANGNLHSYFVVSPTTVTIQASTYSPRLNQTLYSNTVEIKLTVPSYMNGLWILDEINDIHISEISSLLSAVVASGQKVPLGFRFRSSNLALAGALDGVTFLDVNPEYNANVWDLDEVEPVRYSATVSGIVSWYWRFSFG
jgi:hypothetical protein